MANIDHIVGILQLPAYKRTLTDLEELLDFTRHIRVFSALT